VAEQRGLEGVVSKRRDAPYRSGECRDWRKIKTAAWRVANRDHQCTGIPKIEIGGASKSSHTEA
jgi:ATP-dependent DNA ligase